MNKVEFEVATNSWLKQSIVETARGGKINDELLLKEIYEAEENFYAEIEEELGLKDGLIVPFRVPYKGEELPVPYAVSLEKAEAVKDFLRNNPEPMRTVPILVNDSVWVIGDKKGTLHTSINKTDPKKNGGDVERLSSFFFAHPGFNLYSTGYNISIDPQTHEAQHGYGMLQVGRLAPNSLEKIIEILRDDLPKTGAFDLSFVLGKGLVEPPREFTARFGVIDQQDNWIMETKRIPAKTASYRELQLAAHGIALPEST